MVGDAIENKDGFEKIITDFIFSGIDFVRFNIMNRCLGTSTSVLPGQILFAFVCQPTAYNIDSVKLKDSIFLRPQPEPYSNCKSLVLLRCESPWVHDNFKNPHNMRHDLDERNVTFFGFVFPSNKDEPRSVIAVIATKTLPKFSELIYY